MKARILVLTFLLSTLSSIIYANDTQQDLFLMHYWSFNNEAAFTTPDISLAGGELIADIVGTTELLTGTGQDFSAENARNGEEAGAHLRFNNPVGSSLTFRVPTTGFENILFSYETRRSNSGADTQYITYTVDGSTYVPLKVLEVTTTPAVILLDFSEIDAVSDNPDFAVRVEFNDSNNPPNLAGNNRFDNVVVEGLALDETNLPPFVANPRDLLEVIVGEELNLITLGTQIFEDPENDELIFSASSTSEIHFSISEASGENDPFLTLTGTRSGEALLTLSARDITGQEVSAAIRVLVYPDPHSLSSGEFNFTSWSQDSPALSYPANMIFLQSDMNDPGLDDALLFAYNIPVGDYADADLINVGFPYRNNSRTRINGLGERGFSFINTGRGRDLGGAVVALDTRNINRASFSFTAGTEIANSRVYAIRAQYRVVQVAGEGNESSFGDWSDITLPMGEPIEYLRREDGHYTNFIRLDLPSEMLGEEYVQLMFRYYFTGERLSEDSGARDMLRLDNINISDLTDVSAFEPDEQIQKFMLEQNFPNPFNPSTLIRFYLPEDLYTRLTVHNVLGQKVATLVEGQLNAGRHEVNFNAMGLSSGIYVAHIQAEGLTASTRMMLIK
ncbi:MAG: T9SS type A sorting domain-containing protein [Balneolales bacterium]|nr:T9SS type A sorting domain-containing protein [Balneolales bacterium]